MAIVKDLNRQLELIKRGAVEIISEGELRSKIERSIKTNRPLVIKAGFVPTAPDIHLGHTVLLRKLSHFQELGHKIIFLVGDFTATIGDPSGQSRTRETLTFEEVNKNVKTYIDQVAKILDVHDKKLFEVRYNSHWFGRGITTTGAGFMDLTEFLTSIAKKYTVARLIERDDFAKRLKENKPITVLELLYPLMQGYDSVQLKADIEIGGTDQKFNMLVGRDLQQSYGLTSQVVITMPLLEGTDGVKKMSKSYDNYIGINETAQNMFGKIMSISDGMMMRYYELLTDIDLSTIKGAHPMEAKKRLALEIARQYHGEKKAKKASADFEQKFQKRDAFSGMKAIELKSHSKELFLVDILALPGKLEDFENLKDIDRLESRSKFRKLIIQGAITVNEEKVKDYKFALKKNKEYRIKAGKMRFYKIIIR